MINWKKLGVQIISTLLFCFGLLVLFLLNPSLLYAKKTKFKNITLFHNQPLDKGFSELLKESLKALEKAKIADKDLKSEVCLDDGSAYPQLVKSVLGDDLMRAFSNKVVIHGKVDVPNNQLKAWDRQLKFTQFLSHALVHNLQYKKHGFWDANPLGGYPEWKWEGYVEYEVLGKDRDLKTLFNLLETAPNDPYHWIDLGNNEQTIRLHVEYLVLSKYCFEVLNWDYTNFMKDKTTKAVLYKQLAQWYQTQ